MSTPTPALRQPLRRLADADGLLPTPKGRPVANAGLELDRYLPVAKPRGGAHAPLERLFDRVCEAGTPALYRSAYGRWVRHLEALGEAGRTAVRTVELAVEGRIVVGLGGASVHETAIRLHRCYGVPLIPGSAIKGLVRAYAEADVARRQESHPLARQPVPGDPEERRRQPRNANSVLFGRPIEAAFLTCFDAWYVPRSAPGDRPLRRDVVTVHHPTYYRSRGRDGDPGPWDFDDPTPISFVSATGAFLIAVAGPTAEWADLGLGLATRALADRGVGAKTAAGYGRFRTPT